MEHTTEQIIEQIKLIDSTNGSVFHQQNGACKEALDRAIVALKAYEAVGTWQMIGTIGLAYKCSRCEELNIVPTNFCPNCGIRMEKGEDDEQI